jgi:hypothetical protein
MELFLDALELEFCPSDDMLFEDGKLRARFVRSTRLWRMLTVVGEPSVTEQRADLTFESWFLVDNFPFLPSNDVQILAGNLYQGDNLAFDLPRPADLHQVHHVCGKSKPCINAVMPDVDLSQSHRITVTGSALTFFHGT